MHFYDIIICSKVVISITKEEEILGTYNLPRNVKGEGRILFIFSTKALIYTIAGAGFGFIFYLIFGLIKLNIIGIILMILFSLIGFAIGTLKVPETNAFEITKKTGGENIDDVIKRAIKFKMNNKKVYIYDIDKSFEKNSTNEKGGEE